MTYDELMQPSHLAPPGIYQRRRVAWLGRGAALLVCAALPAACINVTAPEEPIVIELNVNIRQEVIYRLAADASNLIDENEDIF
jgi:hypothetical protein